MGQTQGPWLLSSGLMALEHCWSECIILEGNYVHRKRSDRSHLEISYAGFLLTRPCRFASFGAGIRKQEKVKENKKDFCETGRPVELNYMSRAFVHDPPNL